MDKKKEWSVKIFLFDKEYNKLEKIADELDYSVKKLVNKSIRYALKDFEKNKKIKRLEYVEYHKDGELRIYSFKIKEKRYIRLKEISKNIAMSKKELVKCIISYYPKVIQEKENQMLESTF
ncbi:hypothetical protein [Clostridium oceanicum]|uniref:Ribbon-helix-helix protein CopG domain-containing protein n=1 Tax=Clostridium oceanicum TaxID=1543 RepID=A0ABP3UGS4_9CLOT